MNELRVPPVVENPFRTHYRRLILGSALRIAETEIDRLNESGHARRAHRAERLAGMLREATAPPHPPSLPSAARGRWFGWSRRELVGAAWVAAAAFLAVDLATFGVRSWTTTAGDVALIIVTGVWFAVSMDDLVPPPEPQPKQLELFE